MYADSLHVCGYIRGGEQTPGMENIRGGEPILEKEDIRDAWEEIPRDDNILSGEQIPGVENIRGGEERGHVREEIPRDDNILGGKQIPDTMKNSREGRHPIAMRKSCEREHLTFSRRGELIQEEGVEVERMEKGKIGCQLKKQSSHTIPYLLFERRLWLSAALD